MVQMHTSVFWILSFTAKFIFILSSIVCTNCCLLKSINLWIWSKLYFKEALRLSDTMTYAMFLQAFYPRHVTTSLSNQPYNHWPESLSLQSANTDEHARLDVAASGIWGGRFERTFFDVRVFNPYAPSNQTPQIQASYRKHENEKRRKYEQRVVEIEHSTFIPFVLACTGGVGPAATLTLKRVGNLAEKHNSPYSHVMGFLRTRLSFALLRSTLMCLRGTRSSKSQPFNLHRDTVSIAIAESNGSFW